MTLLVRISHASNGYPKTAIVQTVDDLGISTGRRQVLHDGESCEIHVYAGQNLHVSEGEATIAAGEAQTISPGDIGHASSLFGALGKPT